MANLYTKINTTYRDSFKVLFEWEAPERVWKPKTRSWYLFFSLLFILLIFLGALLREYIFIILIVAFAFLWFVFASIAPNNTVYSISTVGIRMFNEIKKWNEIRFFWFSRKGEIYFLNLLIMNELNPDNVVELRLIVNEEDLQKIFDIILTFIDYGDQNDISFNPITRMITGSYIDIDNFVKEIEDSISPDEIL